MASNRVILPCSLALAAMLLVAVLVPAPCSAQGGWNMNQKVKADKVFGYIIDFNKDVTYKVTVRVTSGPNIDVAVFTNDEYFKLKNGEAAVPITGCAMYNVANATLTCALEKGSYNIAFDNSDWGQATSQGQDVIFDYQIVEVYYPGGDGGGGGGSTSSTLYMTAIGGIIAVIIIVVVIIVVAVIVARKKGAGQQVAPPVQQAPPQYVPPQYQQPPQQQYQQQQYQPQYQQPPQQYQPPTQQPPQYPPQ